VLNGTWHLRRWGVTGLTVTVWLTGELGLIREVNDTVAGRDSDNKAVRHGLCPPTPLTGVKTALLQACSLLPLEHQIFWGAHAHDVETGVYRAWSCKDSRSKL